MSRVRVLVLAPHMDDEVLGCGGLLSSMRGECRVAFATESESDVRYVAGDGYRPYDGSDRVAEMRQVADHLGFGVDRWGYETHGLDLIPRAELVARIETLLGRDVSLVLLPGPSHDQDHEAVRLAGYAACRPQRFAGSVLEYRTWGVPAIDEPTLFLPLGQLTVRQKASSMALYRTQLIDSDPTYPYGPESVLAFARAAGRLCGAEYAETFTPRRVLSGQTMARLLGG
jgi:LmbE family N-acetylglucosaminyl deacetylase